MGRRLYRDIIIRGEVYPSIRAAARALGVTHSTVLKAYHAGRLDGVGLGESYPRAMPVRIRGVVYPSVTAAAAALGVGPSAISQALARGAEDRVGLKLSARRPNRTISVVLGGVRFASMSEADRALGFKPGYVSKALRSKSRRSRERILAAVMRFAAVQRRAA